MQNQLLKKVNKRSVQSAHKELRQPSDMKDGSVPAFPAFTSRARQPSAPRWASAGGSCRTPAASRRDAA